MEDQTEDITTELPLAPRNRWIALVTNKFVIATVGFLVWMFFFDPKDIPSSWARRNKLKELQQSEHRISATTTETATELQLLKTSAVTVDKYARENYLMKKDNEDLFIIRTTPESK